MTVLSFNNNTGGVTKELNWRVGERFPARKVIGVKLLQKANQILFMNKIVLAESSI